MKKSVIKKLSVLIAVVAMITSCTDKVSEYTYAIPADASMIVELQMQSLLDKSGVDNDDKNHISDLVKGILSASSFAQIEKIIKDGSESGVSTTSPVYIFADDAFDTPVAVAHVVDVDKLIKTLEVLVAEELINPIEKGNGFYSVKISHNGFVAFNRTTLLFSDGFRDSDTSKIVNLLKQSKDNSIANNANFHTMVKRKGDISCYTTMDAFEYSVAPINLLNAVINPKEVGIIANLYFEKGNISLQGELVTENALLKEFLKKQDQACGKLSEAFVNRFPSSTLMFGALNVNGEKIFDLLQENKEFSEGLSGEEGKKVKEILSSFKGDIAFGLTDVTMTDAPSFAVYAEARSGAALDAIYEFKNMLGLSKGEDIVKLNDNEYMYKSREANIYFGYKDKYMYATSNKSTYKRIGKKADKSIENAVYASHMKGKKQYAVIDIDAVLNLSTVKMLAVLGGRKTAMQIEMARNVSYIEYLSEGDNKFTVNAWLLNKNDNGLKQIVDWAKMFAGL